MIILVTIFGVLLFGAVCVYFSIEENKIKEMFVGRDVIPIKTLMLFSTKEFANRIKKYNKNEDKVLKIEYAHNKYLDVSVGESRKTILLKLDNIQKFMIDKRYNPDEEYVVEDKINKIIYDIWLDYSYKEDYRRIFKEQIHMMLSNEELSKYVFNEINRRFSIIDMNDL